MAASPSNLHLARLALKRYMSHHQLASVREIEDHTDVLIEAAIKGDLATFRSLDAFFTILYTGKTGQPRPSAALHQAAQHGQWDLITAMADPSSENSYVQCDLYRIPAGAIKGGHLWLIGMGMKHPRLSPYFLELDLDLIEQTIKYARGDIFDFYLKVLDYNNQLRYLLRRIVGLIVRYKSVEGLTLLHEYQRGCCTLGSGSSACTECHEILWVNLKYHLETEQTIEEVITMWLARRQAKIQKLINPPLVQVEGRIFRVDPPPIVLVD
jgi:hypothetical protein